ncbi:ATP-dependent DNA helicase [Methanonatronarchaeum sp. AMET-Sl]|uniref:UvrD-helicase domain-containing protein n=1 Tax=Methanonatronarchaeum sp. AMET-Sl TaxID=3037654 RepID=UPI00244DCDCC|nr:ATP-dependent DNA helicase [Methanonatronarchaeum sp. AMET-Sl]WGI18085.1 ATP-dependent DNA helicase [Methanonatronarchaeum sp. AMET-Sl]
MIKPNNKQKELIEQHDGIYLVDAGPGTGKTYSLTERYIQIHQKGIEPENILLITFTRNAANQLKEKIIQKSNINPSKIQDAAITTFHSHCKNKIESNGFNTPQHLGLQDHITKNTRTLESQVLENRHFNRFYSQFKNQHPEYKNQYRVVNNPNNLLHLIKSLAVKGIIPQKHGWYRNSGKHLDGDLQELKNKIEKQNKPRPGKNGPKQSELRKRLNTYKNKCFTQNAPTNQEIRGGRASKQVTPKYIEKAINEDRRNLKKYIHDIYHEYLQYALNKNYLNFSFYLLFAYVMLVENPELQKQQGYKYVMIDEFQDTNEIQLKLALLHAKKGNLCVVGDWKQSIYSFQYADVQNILQFKKRLRKHKKTLNKDHPRINYNTENIKKTNLKQNYRSGQKIIDFAETALTLKAKQNEKIEEKKIQNQITKLKSQKPHKPEIKAIHSEKEKQTILTKIQEITHNPEYTIKPKTNDQKRELTYKDIAILTRTRKFGLELQKKARQHGIPIAYEGGVELFKTNPAILLLAWLRTIQDRDTKKGWAVILENTGYTLDEAKHILKHKKYPKNMTQFRQQLQEIETLTGIARKIFDQYQIDNAYSNKTIEVIDNVFKNSYLNLGEIIHFIEQNIQEEETYEIDSKHREDLATIQTIHTAKGLEYPVIFISNVNQHNFPTQTHSKGRITYNNLTGIRQKKIYNKKNQPYLYDNWKTHIINKSIKKDYNEERRLMYVAMTRAKKYLYITADTKNKSQFYKDLNLNKKQIKPDIKKTPKQKTQPNQFKTKPTKQKTPIKLPITKVINKTKSKGRGTKHGINLHKYAEKYINGLETQPKNQDEKNVKQFIDQLKGTKIPEKKCTLPLHIKNTKIILNGKIDLIHKTNNKIEIIDYKTEKSKQTKKQHQTQISLYYHTLKQIYPETKITPIIYYTQTNQKQTIKPQPITKLKKQITQTLKKQQKTQK